MHRLSYEDDKRWARILAQLELTRIAAVQAPPLIHHRSLHAPPCQRSFHGPAFERSPGHFFDQHHAGAAGADRATTT